MAIGIEMREGGGEGLLQPPRAEEPYLKLIGLLPLIVVINFINCHLLSTLAQIADRVAIAEGEHCFPKLTIVLLLHTALVGSQWPMKLDPQVCITAKPNNNLSHPHI